MRKIKPLLKEDLIWPKMGQFRDVKRKLKGKKVLIRVDLMSLP